jgi:putative DNA primase/helicase
VSSFDTTQPLVRETFPHQPRSGASQLPATIDNVEYMLRQYGVKCRYNVIKKKIEILIPGHSCTLDNWDNVSITRIISLARLNGLSSNQVPAYVDVLADQNPYNPAAEWINSKSWDGKDRLQDICETISERKDFPPQLKIILIYRWFLSAVAAALMPSGFKNRGVLTFQGPQGVGKTRWIMSLVSDEELRESIVKVDHYFDGSKDSVLGAVNHWLVEIGELDSSLKRDMSRLKGVLTRDYDKVRRPYARTESEYQRRTVFFASVNKSDFLVDMTGNTRWWTIPVSKINYEHGIDMQQFFAQMATDFHNGKQWWLTPEEEAQLESCNRDHLSISVIREKLMDEIDMERIGDSGIPALKPLEVLECLGYQSPTNAQCKECGSILRELFGEPKRINGSNKWRVPFKPYESPYSSKHKEPEERKPTADDF